jgi:hypothetical protein
MGGRYAERELTLMQSGYVANPRLLPNSEKSGRIFAAFSGRLEIGKKVLILL